MANLMLNGCCERGGIPLRIDDPQLHQGQCQLGAVAA